MTLCEKYANQIPLLWMLLKARGKNGGSESNLYSFTAPFLALDLASNWIMVLGSFHLNICPFLDSFRLCLGLHFGS